MTDKRRPYTTFLVEALDKSNEKYVQTKKKKKSDQNRSDGKKTAFVTAKVSPSAFYFYFIFFFVKPLCTLLPSQPFRSRLFLMLQGVAVEQATRFSRNYFTISIVQFISVNKCQSIRERVGIENNAPSLFFFFPKSSIALISTGGGCPGFFVFRLLFFL